ncbi:Oxygen-dependent choline dehydrogenase-like 1, partial [Homarus americanus]
VRTALARREVVLSAGAVGSPKLLMLSGVGPSQHLQEHHIPVVADVAGVGENFHDHPGVYGLTWIVNKNSAGNILSLVAPSSIKNYLTNGQGPLSVPLGFEAVAWLPSKEGDPLWPQIQFLFSSLPSVFDLGLTLTTAVNLRKDVLPGCEGLKEGSDSYWECYLRHMVSSAIHFAGSCKMGPVNDYYSVVDHNLKYVIRGCLPSQENKDQVLGDVKEIRYKERLLLRNSEKRRIKKKVHHQPKDLPSQRGSHDRHGVRWYDSEEHRG